MFGIDQRALRVAWTFFVFALILILVYRLGQVLFIFALALIFAHLLSPVLDFIERLAPQRVPRVAVLGMVYAILVGALVMAAIPIGSRVSREALALAHRLPAALEGDPLAKLPIPRWLESYRPQVHSFLQDRLKDLGQTLAPTLAAVGGHVLSGLGVLVAMVLIPILGFFFLKDGPAIRAAIVNTFEGSRRELVDDILSDIHHLLVQYIRALVLQSMATFAAYAVFFVVTGMPFPLLLAGFAAVLEFIPAVGPSVAIATILVSALFTGFGHFIILIVFLVVYRLFLDYVLSPYLMSAGVALHPLLVLFGVLAGEQLAGIPGMFLSVPVMAALRLIILRLSRHQPQPVIAP
ncbi:MAG TPA: AI-2E family transporter [Bryobacteraceae bacterium]|nr:AI-2E family transporter [Bryobacteraceae bacterium]